MTRVCKFISNFIIFLWHVINEFELMHTVSHSIMEGITGIQEFIYDNTTGWIHSSSPNTSLPAEIRKALTYFRKYFRKVLKYSTSTI